MVIKVFNMKRIRVRLALISLVLIVSILLAGCQYLPYFGTTTATTTPTPTQTPGPINPTYSPPTQPPPTTSPLQLPSIADVVANVKPSVVAVDTEVVIYDIFNIPRTEKGAGSGWIIDPSGIIVTNNHVVEGAKSVTVTLDNGQTYPAKTVRTDPVNDLAVIDIGIGNLPAATIGDSAKMRVGDWVIAIGNALGQGIRATQGIISNTDVTISVDTGETLYNLLETTAAINPGNSGGPLVNLSGQVIGITSAKLAAVGIEGMGYAIASDTAKPIILELIQKGYVTRPWLGISVTNVTQLAKLRYNLAVDQGGLLTEVVPGSPADKAGLQAQDVIVRFAGKDINTADDLVQAIRASTIGQSIDIVYYRGDTQYTTAATPVESPPPAQ